MGPVRKKWTALLLSAAVVLAAILYFTRSQSLGVLLSTDQITSTVEATLVQSTSIKNADGSISIRNPVIELPQPADSEAGAALIDAIDSVSCRHWLRLPFEKVLVYSSGGSSLSVSFSVGNQSVVLSLLEDSRTLYDLGGSGQSYRVPKDTFPLLQEVVLTYGVPREE